MDKKLKKVLPSEVTDAYSKIQNWFYDFPTAEMSLNEVCSAVNVSKTSAKTAVESLLHEGLLQRKILGKLWRISCNQNHIYNLIRKVPYHLGLVYASGIVNAVHETLPYAKTIILFGSYRKGDDIESSDIDIAAEIIGDEEQKIIQLGILSQIGYRQNVRVNLHVFSRNKINLNLFANIANGIVLEGFLEARP